MVQQENDMLRSGAAGRQLGPPSRGGTPGSLGGGPRQPMSPHSLGGNMVRAAAAALQSVMLSSTQTCYVSFRPASFESPIMAVLTLYVGLRSVRLDVLMCR